MNSVFYTFKGFCIAEVISDKLEIMTIDDVVDLIGNAGYQGAQHIILHEKI